MPPSRKPSYQQVINTIDNGNLRGPSPPNAKPPQRNSRPCDRVMKPIIVPLINFLDSQDLKSTSETWKSSSPSSQAFKRAFAVDNLPGYNAQDLGAKMTIDLLMFIQHPFFFGGVNTSNTYLTLTYFNHKQILQCNTFCCKKNHPESLGMIPCPRRMMVLSNDCPSRGHRLQGIEDLLSFDKKRWMLCTAPTRGVLRWWNFKYRFFVIHI